MDDCEDYEDEEGKIEPANEEGPIKATVSITGWSLEGLGARVVKLAAQVLVKAVKDDVIAAARAELDEQVKAKVGEIVTGVFETPIRKTNSYGEPTGEAVPFRAHIMDVTRAYLDERVDDRGYADNYGSGKKPRAQWLVSSAVADVVNKEFKPQIDAAIAAAKEQLKNAVASLMTEKFGKALGVP